MGEGSTLHTCRLIYRMMSINGFKFGHKCVSLFHFAKLDGFDVSFKYSALGPNLNTIDHYLGKKNHLLIFKFKPANSLRKQAYSNIPKILPPKNENFQIKILILFSYFCSNHRLWVLVRTASARRF